MDSGLIYQHIGELIRSRRKKLKPPLTQAKLAQRIGISRASLANIETGRQSVLVHQLYVFAEALGLVPSDFLIPISSDEARIEWNGLLPENLKPGQKEQIARLLSGPPLDYNREKEKTHGKPT